MSRLDAMSVRRRFASVAVAVAVAGAMASCGSSKPLPRDIPSASAPGLLSNLEQVINACRRNDPGAAENAARQYHTAVNALPDTVDPDVKKVLTDTSDNLTELAANKAGCGSGATGASGVQGFQPATTTTDTTATATTPPSTTTSATTTETQPPPSTPAGGGGDQAPNGQGPGGGGAPGQQGEPSPGSGGGVGIGKGGA